MTDVVFFVKAPITKAIRALPWPKPTEFVYVEPGPHACQGADRLCSSAFSRVWQGARDESGRALPGLLRRYAPHVTDVGRVAFVGFSAAHGLLSPLAREAADREAIDAYILIDACFGAPSGYAEFGMDAALGERLLASSTGDTGGDACFQASVVAPLATAGFDAREVETRPELPAPSGGSWQIGDSLFFDRYGAELHHWEMGELPALYLQAYLLPRWRGLPWGEIALYSTIALAAAAGGAFLGRRP